jgi:hypothetical protein
MADNNDSILNKKPNSLDRIGEKSVESESLRLMHQRAGIETIEMQRLRHEMQALHDQNRQIFRQMAELRGGIGQPSPQLFQALGLTPKQASTLVATVKPESIVTAASRLLPSYEKSYQEKTSSLEERYSQRVHERQSVAARMLEESIISRVSHPREGARSLILRDQSIIEEAQRYAQISTPERLSRGLERASRARAMSGERLIEMSKDVMTPEGRGAFVKAEEEYQRKLSKEISLEQALKTQQGRRRGLESTAERSERLVEGIMASRSAKDIEDRARAGKFGSMTDVQKDLANAEQAFINASKVFREELSKSKTVSDDTAKSLKDANAELEKQRRIVREVGAQGGGGGRGRFMSALASTGDILGRGVDLVSYGLVGAQGEKLALQTQMAAAMNQRYSDAYAATQGDMGALRRTAERQFERSAQYGGAYSTRANIAGYTGAGIDIATGVSAAAASLLGGGVPFAMSGGLITQNLMSGTRGLIQTGMGLTGAGTQLQFSQGFNNLMNTVNAVPDAARQSFFDFRMNAYRSMMGAGQYTSRMYDDATSRGFINEMAGLGISPQESARLYGTGARNIGAQFTRDSGYARQIVRRGAELQAAGYMSAEDYMQRIGQITGMGGSQKDLEETLARAVARGVDDAKSLNNLLGVIGGISREGASRGIATYGAVKGMVEAGLDIYKNVPLEETLKQNLVGSQLQTILERGRSTAVDVPNMMYMAGVQDRFKGISPVQAARLGAVGVEELAGKRDLVKGLRVGEEVPLAIRAALGEAEGAFVDAEGKFRGIEGISSEIASKAIIKGIPQTNILSLQDQKVIREYAQTGDESILKKLSKEAKGIVSTGELTTVRGIVAGTQPTYRLPETPIPMLTGEAAAAQRITAIGAEAQAKEMFSGQRFYENLIAPPAVPMQGAGPLSAISTIMGRVMPDIDPEKAGIRAAQAAEKMTLDTTEFDKSINRFSIAVDKLVKAVEPLGTNLSAPSNSVPSEFFSTFGGPVAPAYAARRLLGM